MSLVHLELWQLALLFSPLIIIFWSLWHVHSHEFASLQEKYMWLLLCALVPILGTIIYVFFGLKRIKSQNKL